MGICGFRLQAGNSSSECGKLAGRGSLEAAKSVQVQYLSRVSLKYTYIYVRTFYVQSRNRWPAPKVALARSPECPLRSRKRPWRRRSMPGSRKFSSALEHRVLGLANGL